MRDPQSNANGVTAAPEKLLLQCQQILERHLLEVSGVVVESTREALFSMAEKAGSTQLQSRLHEGTRRLRDQQQHFAEQLQQAVADNFTDFRNGTTEFRSVEPEPSTDYDDSDLQLIEEHELEESLLLSDFVAKAEMRYTLELFELNPRLSEINGHRPVGNHTNPCGPLQLSHALKRSAGELDLATEHRLILMRRFDDLLQDDLKAIYGELNQLLIEAGILPHVKATAPEPPARSSGTPGSPDQTDQADDAAPETDFFGRVLEQAQSNRSPELSAADQSSSRVLNTLRNLLDRNRPPTKAPSNVAPAEQLQNILGQLRQQRQSQEQRPAEPYNADALRDLLQSRLGTDPSTGQNYQLSNNQHQTVDIIGMLYDFVQKEIALHQRAQSMLAKLQMPLLEVALKEDSFLEDTSHPARQFFNTIADAGELWWDDEPDRSPALRKIEQMVERASAAPPADSDAFGDILQDVNKQVQTLSRRAQLAEKRNIEAAKGRERLETARTRASKLINELVRRYSPPALVRTLLREPWTDYLALVVMRDGDHSELWDEGVKAAKTLTVSVRNDLEGNLREKIQQRLPWLHDTLRQGLAQVGFFESDIDNLLSTLRECQQWALDENARPEDAPAAMDQSAPATKPGKPTEQPSQPADSADPPSVVAEQPATAEPAATEPVAPTPAADAEQPAVATPAPTPVADAEEPAVAEVIKLAPAAAPKRGPEPATAKSASGEGNRLTKIEQMLADAARAAHVEEEAAADEAQEAKAEAAAVDLREDDLSEDERRWLAKLRIMPFGTWLEMRAENDSWVKRKLSWFSPVTGRCLLVNSRGARTDELTLENLARDMASGRIRVYRPPAKPLMDRAMEWMLNKLRGGSRPASA